MIESCLKDCSARIGAPQSIACASRLTMIISTWSAVCRRHRADTISADVRSLPRARLSVDALDLPAVSRFTSSMPQPATCLGPCADAFDLDIGSQQPHALFDPASSSPLRPTSTSATLAWKPTAPATVAPAFRPLHPAPRPCSRAGQPEPGQGEPGQPGRVGRLRRGRARRGRVRSGWTWCSVAPSPAGARPPRRGQPAIRFGADSIQANGRIDGTTAPMPPRCSSLQLACSPTPPPAAAAKGGHMACSVPPGGAAGADRVAGQRHHRRAGRGNHRRPAHRCRRTGRGYRASRLPGPTGAAPAGMLHATLYVDLDGLAAAALPPAAIALVPRHWPWNPARAGYRSPR